ncbi:MULTISPECIES: acyltransferase [Thalassotalea]|uniref:acyltransferase n=1 Tax=Thalassotalea TaxID=1518149 RepID=UPI000942D014|nr:MULTISPECIES: acyltransferase [Thalassotalea]OKY26757.1 hypothetical protein BI291_01830 [Thalassotalea sp. PP2-459]
MNIVLKLLILLLKDFSIFSAPGLRRIRWWLYRKYFNAHELHVDTRVTIVKAHKNNNSKLILSSSIHIGKDVYIDFSGGVHIEEQVSISEGAKIYTHNHNIHDGETNWRLNGVTFSAIHIEKYSWIGANAIILPSVDFIGQGAIIAAGAVLTKNAESFGIYAGNPAVKVGERRIGER